MNLDLLDHRITKACRAIARVKVLLISEAMTRGMPYETRERPDLEKVIMYLCEDDPIAQVPLLAARSEASDPWLAVADMWLRMQREGVLSKKPGWGSLKSGEGTMTKEISHEEAKAIASRLVWSAYRRDGQPFEQGKGMISHIPARPDLDDDIRITDYIKQQEAKDSVPGRYLGVFQALDSEGLAGFETVFSFDTIPEVDAYFRECQDAGIKGLGWYVDRMTGDAYVIRLTRHLIYKQPNGKDSDGPCSWQRKFPAETTIPS